MDVGEDLGQQAVARTWRTRRATGRAGKTRIDENMPMQRAEQHDQADPVERMAAGQQGELFERVDHRRARRPPSIARAPGR